MKGTTNSQRGTGGGGEKLVISLKTNQASHEDLIGAKFSVVINGNATEYTWQGASMTIPVTPMLNYTVEFGDVEGYAKPESVTHTAVAGNDRFVTGIYNTELVTVNVSADEGSVSGYEIQIGREVLVPTEYIQLENIESTGKQFIDTGIIANFNTRVVIDFEATKVSEATFIFGTDYNSPAFALCYDANKRFDFKVGRTSRLSPKMDILNTRYVFDATISRLIIGDEAPIFSGETSLIDSSYTLKLFAVYKGSYISHGKLYSCKIYDGETLVRDYVPAKDKSGVIGLYDKVNNNFVKSASSTEFVAGDEIGIVELSQIEVVYTQTTSSATYKFPYDTLYTIKASDVRGYTTPSEQSFTASQPTRNVDVVYKEIETGIFIYRIDTGTLIPPESWNTDDNDYALGVAVVTENCKFVISKSDYSGTIRWGDGIDLAALTNYTDATIASSDFDGVSNSAKIIGTLGSGTYAAISCSSYEWTDSHGDIHKGYLGSAGEWKAVDDNYTKIIEALELISVQSLGSGYWTSTEESANYAWVIDPGKEQGPYRFSKGSYISMRPFFQLP